LISRLQNRQIISGYLFAIGATALWAGNFIIARGLSDSISPINLAFYRWVVAVIVFLPFALRPLISEWDILKENIPYLSITFFTGDYNLQHPNLFSRSYDYSNQSFIDIH